eukprot:TRINITY_DN11026_c0_g1_i1.p1 TRINITY_DN11026_c0_g1~~TRINITY_DN11026_c0_g1_i1.p1  ORF type:complete len:297 (-),score=60.76 TRINITY_DN11026_c0_g1_i1:130-1020(-)
MSGNAPGGRGPPPAPFFVDLLVSFASNATGKLVGSPIDRVKFVLQLRSIIAKRSHINPRELDGIGAITKYIYRTEGITGFFKVFGLEVARFIPTQLSNVIFKDIIRTLFRNKPSDSYGVFFLSNLASGAVAGGVSLLFVYPIDYVTTLWTANLVNETGVAPYSSIKDIVVSTYREYGITGFYPGMLVSLFGIVLYRGLYFGLYDSVRPLLGRKPSFLASFGLGYLTTVAAGLASYPIDTIRRAMMLTHSHNALATANAIVKDSGVQGLFAGASVNILRTIASSLALVVYDMLTQGC